MTRTRLSGLSMGNGNTTPIRRSRSLCCARTVSGARTGVTTAPPRSVMNSRRRMLVPELRRRHLIGSNDCFDRGVETGIKTIAAVHSQCPLWVISGHMQCNRQCPLYPQ